MTGGSGPAGLRARFPAHRRADAAMVIAEQSIDWLRRQYFEECEQRRTFLWIPVIFAAGILVYFQLTLEPALTPLIVASIGLSGVAMFRFRRDRSFHIWAVAALVSLGATSAKMRTEVLAGPHISEPVYGSVRGTVSEVQIRSDRTPRLILSDPGIDARRTIDLPRKVRITLLRNDAIPTEGLRIIVRSRLGPVPGPAPAENSDLCYRFPR